MIKRKPHEIVCDTIVQAWNLTALSKRWKKPDELIENLFGSESREASEDESSKTFRKEYIDPSLDVVFRLKQKFNKTFLKR